MLQTDMKALAKVAVFVTLKETAEFWTPSAIIVARTATKILINAGKR